MMGIGLSQSETTSCTHRIDITVYNSQRMKMFEARGSLCKLSRTKHQTGPCEDWAFAYQL